MKKVSDVFKSIRFAKGEPRDKPHKSTDEEEHYTVGEKEWEQQVKHAKKMAMQEEKKDKYDEGEYDQEGDMAKSDLRSIISNAQKLHDMIDDADNLPEWVQSKITVAEDYISTVANYMTAEMSESVQLDELSPATKASYKEKATKAIAELKPHTKGEYGDIAKNMIKRREKGLAKMKEDVEQLDEKNAPTNPSLWSRAKALARSKFDVYPSAYANGWAAKWYKSKGGGWKSVSEATELPFEPDKKPVKKATPGKYGVGYSTARHLARMAMKKQAEKYKKPIKEQDDMSKKAQIVKDVMKKKKDEKSDKFQTEPIISQSVTRNY